MAPRLKRERHGACTSTPAAYIAPAPNGDAFWRLDDILLYMLRFLSLMQVLQFGHLNKRTQELTKTYLRGRIIRYTSPFFTRRRPNIFGEGDLDLRRFFQTLEVTRSWIVGSVALAAVSVLSDPPHPNNLNIICKLRGLSPWMNVLVHELQFTMVSYVSASGPYSRAGLLFVTFQHPDDANLKVTVTTTHKAHIGSLFFASPNTDQQIAISPYEIISPFIHSVASQQHLRGFRRDERRLFDLGQFPPDPLYRSASRFPGAIDLHESTYAWGRPCGAICPGTWRLAKGLDRFANIKWGGMDGLDDFIDPALEELGRTRLKFRTGVRCTNGFCPLRRGKGLLEA